MEDEARNFIKLWLTAIASLCYCYLISSNLPAKKLRFLFLLPLFSIFTFFPFTLSAADPTGVPTFFFCSWLANFKLLFCSFGTGLLTVSVAQHSFSMFVAFACHSILLRPQESASFAETQTTSLLLHDLASELLILLLYSLSPTIRDLHSPEGLAMSYSITLYRFIDAIVGFCIHWVQIVIGIESPFNQPYMTTSLQNIWGRRCNLIVTIVLRHIIYQSLRRLVESTIGVQLTPLTDVLTVLLVSGMLRKLFYKIIRRLGSICRRLNRVAVGLATVSFVLFTATLLFTSPLVWNGADVRVWEECMT